MYRGTVLDWVLSLKHVLWGLSQNLAQSGPNKYLLNKYWTNEPRMISVSLTIPFFPSFIKWWYQYVLFSSHLSQKFIGAHDTNHSKNVMFYINKQEMVFFVYNNSHFFGTSNELATMPSTLPNHFIFFSKPYAVDVLYTPPLLPFYGYKTKV